MKFGFIAVAGIPTEMVDLAIETEAHGWDGFFTFDGGGFDAWSLLAGAAMVTERITLEQWSSSPRDAVRGTWSTRPSRSITCHTAAW